MMMHAAEVEHPAHRDRPDHRLAGIDEVGLYAFDTTLQEVRPFTKMFVTEGVWEGTRAFGATSLWDVVAATAKEVAARQQRRALIVITDGVDSASTLTPAEVSTIASRLDVPVYMLVGDDELERGEATLRDMASGQQRTVPLASLADELQAVGSGA